MLKLKFESTSQSLENVIGFLKQGHEIGKEVLVNHGSFFLN